MILAPLCKMEVCLHRLCSRQVLPSCGSPQSKPFYRGCSHLNGLVCFQKRFEGTLVNPDTFFAWKAKFDAEFAHLKISKEKDTGKLTGREMFLRDTTLVQSDLKFLEDTEGKVAQYLLSLCL